MMPRPNRRPTLRDVAALARVSHMTVSRVVNGSRTVAGATEERVQAAIEQLGYRPDPALSALAAYRSNRPEVREQPSVLAFLDCDADAYSGIVLDGASAEAKLHGYSIERIELTHDPAQQQRVCRRLFHCGVRGLLFGPSNTPWKFHGWDWLEFAAVSLGALSHEPALHSVCMDYFEGAMSGFQFLGEKGCRRIALVLDARRNTRTGHRWLGGYCAAAKQARKPILWEKGTGSALNVRRWMKAKKVDGILTIDTSVCGVAQSLGIPVVFLNDLGCPPEVPHLKLDPREIGTEGVRLLHPLVLRRDFGLPSEPKRISLRGVWVK